MTLIEIGGLASAILATLTLMNKLITLITAINSLIQQIDQLSDSVAQHEQRLNHLEHERSPHYAFR